MRKGIFGIAVTAALVFAASALAASPAGQGYGGRGGVQSELGAAAGGALPFTGLDVALLGIGSALLLIVGVALRRAARAH